MGIFNNNKKPAGMLEEDELDYNPVDYDSVLEWLCGLSISDYSKVLEVAAIYRKAQQDSADALELINHVRTYIIKPITESDNILDDDDLDSSFLDEPDFLDEKPAKSKQTIQVEARRSKKA